MNLEKYYILIKVMESGSFTAAAEELNYTPSGISRMIQSLEDECGFRLLLRSKTGVIPTAECKEMIPAIRQMLLSADLVKKKALAIAGIEEGVINIGSAYSAFYGAIASCIRTFKEQHPGFTINIINGSSTELVEMMGSHEIDICIISKRGGSFDWNLLFLDPLMAWLPATDKETTVLDARDIPNKNYIEIYPSMDSDNARYFSRCRITPNTAYTTMDSLTAMKLVEAGLGITVNNHLNSLEISSQVHMVPLDPPYQVEIGIALAKDASAGVREFYQAMAKQLTQYVKVELKP